MKILSIETSCDETAISIVECEGDLLSPKFNVLASAIISQINLHREYGGVFPTLAKREHATNLPIILKKVLLDSNQYQDGSPNFFDQHKEVIQKTLSKEIGLYESLEKDFSKITKPQIDYIAVTVGPGLAPALWVGISFAKALGLMWDIPLIPTNHMEGHITSVLVNQPKDSKVEFPALAVLISGGHTEIVHMENWGKYTVIGATLDDAVGEAFDKSARMMGLPYPGGPEVSKLADEAYAKNIHRKAILPRPMLHSKDLNFSFAGLKTAVLYYIRDNFNGDSSQMNTDDKADLSRELQESVVEILLKKTETAISQNDVRTLIVAGGVISNQAIRKTFTELENKYPYLKVKIPTTDMATDNSTMIATAGYITILTNNLNPENLVANGNLKLQ